MLEEIRFEWDRWNTQKNEIKHGVSRVEAESAFYDPDYKLFRDQKHSKPSENRFILYGRSLEARILMVGFIMRSHKIRLITARAASKKEREIYESKS